MTTSISSEAQNFIIIGDSKLIKKYKINFSTKKFSCIALIEIDNFAFSSKRYGQLTKRNIE